MNVSGVSSSYKSPELQQTERTMLVVKKQQDVTKEQAQALVDMVKASGVGQNLNVYA